MLGNRDRMALMAQVLRQYQQQQGSPPIKAGQSPAAMMGGGPTMARSRMMGGMMTGMMGQTAPIGQPMGRPTPSQLPRAQLATRLFGQRRQP